MRKKRWHAVNKTEKRLDGRTGAKTKLYKLCAGNFLIFSWWWHGYPCRNTVVFVVSLHVYNRCFGAQQITCNPSNSTHVETVNAGVSIWFLLQNVSWWSFPWRILFCTLLIRGILTFWLTCASQMYYPLIHYLWQVNYFIVCVLLDISMCLGRLRFFRSIPYTSGYWWPSHSYSKPAIWRTRVCCRRTSNLKLLRTCPITPAWA